MQCFQLHCGLADMGADDNDAAVPLIGAHKILPPQQRLIAHRAQDFDHGCRAAEHKYLAPGCRAQIGGNEHRYIVIAYGVDNHFVEAGNAHQLFADGVIVAAAQLVKRDGHHLLRRVGAAGFFLAPFRQVGGAIGERGVPGEFRLAGRHQRVTFTDIVYVVYGISAALQEKRQEYLAVIVLRQQRRTAHHVPAPAGGT